jgi:hypothetical protein
MPERRKAPNVIEKAASKATSIGPPRAPSEKDLKIGMMPMLPGEALLSHGMGGPAADVLEEIIKTGWTRMSGIIGNDLKDRFLEWRKRR